MESTFIKSINISESVDYYQLKDCISYSGMKKLKQSPAHYKEAEEVKETDALIFGSAYHCFILEPERFETDYYVFDDTAICQVLIGEGYKSPRSTKDYKVWQESEMRVIGQKKVITIDVFERIKKMRDRLFSHSYARMLLSKGEIEKGYSGTIETESGTIPVKFRPDLINSKKKIIVDLKTTIDASSDEFKKLASQNEYHLQAAFYSDLLELLDGDNRAYTFIFIAQEKTSPYAFNIFEASPQFISQGRFEYEMLLQLFKYCTDRDVWPGYQVFCENRYGILQLDLPAWKIKDITYFDHYKPSLILT